ncbi:hypothetical protein SUGI_0147830 [Cryptomeria japonica]|nr:hypothetical protein SUGI_0147830 [Cryptomeria japonica]
MDVYSLVMAWGLESGDDTGMVRRILKALVPSDYLGELVSLLEWAILGVGFDIGEGVQHDELDEVIEREKAEAKGARRRVLRPWKVNASSRRHNLFRVLRKLT